MKTRVLIQKRFADSDILGHINNVNLQHYFDVGKTDFFERTIKVGLLWREQGLITASTYTDYLAQTRFDEEVAVETQLERIGNKSFTLIQRLVNAESGEEKAVSRTVLVVFDFNKQESIEIPAEWRTVLNDYLV